MKLHLNRRLLFPALLVFLTAAGLFIRFQSRDERAIRPRTGPLIESVYGLGSVVAPRTFQLKVAVSSMIRAIHVQEGDRVAKGHPLVTFDEGTTRTAPFAGVITEVPFHEGEVVAPNSSVITLVDLSRRYMEVSFEQQAVLRVRQGQRVTVTFESLRGQKFPGTVDSLFPREGQFIARIGLREYPEGTLPAMTADVAIEAGRRENVLQIPVSAVSEGKVIRIRGGQRQKVEVQIGVSDGEWAELVSGDVTAEDEVLQRNP